MKKISLLIILIFSAVCGFAQTSDSIKVEAKPQPKPLTQIQRDSLLIDIEDHLEYIADVIVENRVYKRDIGRYKIYRTTNIYNNLKLDTKTGRVTAIQISLGESENRMEYEICDAIETDYKYQIVGRFELYPTGNNYNFILLDTMFGLAYQVQWSTKSKECGRWFIY